VDYSKIITIEPGKRSGNDNAIWEYARKNGFVIVSKDSDFRER